MKPLRLWVYRLMTCLMPETRMFGVKVRLLRWCGARVGDNVRISSSAIIQGNGGLEIGDGVWLGAGGLIISCSPAVVKIGSQCDFGPQVLIITGTHQIAADGGRVAGKGCSKSVTVGEGCWIGARTLILPDVVLPERTLVAAGSVVATPIDSARCLVAGVPAIIKRRL